MKGKDPPPSIQRPIGAHKGSSRTNGLRECLGSRFQKEGLGVRGKPVTCWVGQRSSADSIPPSATVKRQRAGQGGVLGRADWWPLRARRRFLTPPPSTSGTFQDGRRPQWREPWPRLRSRFPPTPDTRVVQSARLRMCRAAGPETWAPLVPHAVVWAELA